MSRKKYRLSDFDKFLKPIHLGGKPQTYTISHVGVITQQPRQKETVFAGENPEELERVPEIIPVLHFYDTRKSLRCTAATNRAKLAEYIGENDLSMLVDAKITVATALMENFGREFVSIQKVELAKISKDLTPYRTERVNQLSKLRLTEKGLLAERGVEQAPLTGEQVKAMSIEDIEKLIEQIESNIVDLQASQVTEIK